MRRGDRGDEVEELQRNLNTVIGAGLSVDGDFGPATERAVRTFQDEFGLEVDGVYGRMSAKVMAQALEGKRGRGDIGGGEGRLEGG